MRASFLLCLSVFGVLPHVAHGQSTPTGSVQLDEIIVTANKRAENVQDVPISISNFSTQELEALQANTLSLLGGHVSNLWIPPATEAGQSFITLRGIGQGIAKSSGRGVGVYLDGMYISADTMMDAALFDAARVEVLKGPQGTLFGRDTIGGAILITSVIPGDAFSARAHVELGNLGHVRVTGAADIPLRKDKAVLRVSATNWRRDGYILNTHTGRFVDNRNRRAALAQLYLTPKDRLSVRLLAGYGWRDEWANSMGESISNIGSDQIPYTINLDTEEQQTQTSNRLGAHVSYQWDNGFSLDWISSLARVDDFYIQDGDRLPDAITVARFTNEVRERSTEIRLSLPEMKRITAMVGFFAQGEDKAYSPTFPLMGEVFLDRVFHIPPANQPTDELDGQLVQIDTQNLGLFAHGTVQLNDTWKVFGGARISQVRKQLDYQIFGETFALFGLGALREVTEIKNTPVSWQMGLQRKLGEDAQGYVKISRGFRSSSVKDDFISQADISANAGFFTRPEFVTNYEGGIKSMWFDRTVRANLSAFYMEYSDIQVSISQPPFLFLKSLTNAAKAHVSGFEAEAEAQINSHLHLRASLGHVLSRYDVFQPSPGVDYAGLSFGNAPTWSFSLAADFEHGLRQWGDLAWHLDVTSNIAPNNTVPGETAFVGDHEVLNGWLSFTPDQGNWQVRLWAKNLLDIQKPVAAKFWGAGLGPLIENHTNRYQEPRTFGLTFKTNFGG